MSFNPNSRKSEQTSDVDDDSVLFEDDENEQFIKALDQPPKGAESKADAKQVLDDILPDAKEEEQEEISEEEAEEEDSFQQPSHAHAPHDVMSAISQTPIQIQLEIGRLECSLQKLIELQPNDVLSLDKPLGQMIDLRLNGRLIGRGQIVKLGNQLGLRISELADR